MWNMIAQRLPRKGLKIARLARRFYHGDPKSETRNGAVTIWGLVGEVQPPHIVLPITVEPLKARLCIDARFLDLWRMDTPSSLGKPVDVPRFVHRNSFMSKIDDKSGYDHILLTKQSTEYFGIKWRGLWWVCTTLPFGWKNSPLCVSDDWSRCDQLL